MTDITTSQPHSLRVMLGGSIDFAGLFPPARLPLDQAASDFARFREEEDAWMLATFVIPAGRIPDFLELPVVQKAHRPFPLSVLGPPDSTPESWAEDIANLLTDLAGLRAAHPDLIRIEMMEVAFPDSEDPREAWRMLEDLRAAMKSTGLPEATSGPLVFLEVAHNRDGPLGALCEALQASGPHRIGAKIRTGGVVREAFPEPAAVARFIRTCHEAGLPFKATAGLHHPLRQYRDEVGCPMHGFLNLFVAAAIAHTHGVGEMTLRDILETEDAGAFTFGDEGATWRGIPLRTDDLTAAGGFFRSFGSCSFDEPREDLRSLHLL
jgi:hypothetical protein